MDMKQYNLISTKNIVQTGIVELDKEIGGLYIGEKTILFGTDETGVNLFIEKLKNECRITSDSMLESRNRRSVYIYECKRRNELPGVEADTAENIFEIFENDGRHYVRVCKNRMNGVFDFECEIS